jgi:hypothetical protein
MVAQALGAAGGVLMAGVKRTFDAGRKTVEGGLAKRRKVANERKERIDEVTGADQVTLQETLGQVMRDADLVLSFDRADLYFSQLYAIGDHDTIEKFNEFLKTDPETVLQFETHFQGGWKPSS